MQENDLRKEPLNTDDVSVNYVPSIVERTVTNSIRHECIIENYSSLKDRIYYTMSSEVAGIERTLKLFKTKKGPTFQFHCELTNSMFPQKFSYVLEKDKMVFFIMYDKYKIVKPGELTETNYGFSIDVPNSIILHSHNKYLHENNKLVVHFSYRNYIYTRAPICGTGKSTKDDEEALSNDLLSLYESRKFVDYKFESLDKKLFFAHKSVCRASSKLIREILKLNAGNESDMHLEVEARIAEIVIRYMYSGKLPGLSLNDLIKVAEEVDELDLGSLRQSLTIALRNKLNKSNAKKIHEDAMSCDMHDLAIYADKYLAQDEQ